MKLKDRVAIVTGGGRGIGLAISRALACEGADVVIVQRSVDSGQKAARETGGMFVQADVSDRAQVEAMVDRVLEAYGRVDVLVNNVGFHQNDVFEAETTEIWQRMFDVNVMGTVYPSQFVVPAMKKQGGGRIVNISSKAGVVGEPGHAAYSASKGAVIALTRSMAIELAPYQITVNSVAPGPVLTDMLTSRFDQVGVDRLGADAPLGRVGLPEDIAGAVLLLCTDDSSWITGQIWSIDGGLSVLK